MIIDPEILKALRNSGLTCKEMADRLRDVWRGLPTTRQLANNIYKNSKAWRKGK